MIEEFRVSLFAQTLKTSIPISAKRIEKQIALCRWEVLLLNVDRLEISDFLYYLIMMLINDSVGEYMAGRNTRESNLGNFLQLGNFVFSEIKFR